MSVGVNPHYDKVIKDASANKDSIFEPCRVSSFDTKRLTATTYGIRSKSIKKNVIVLFPSMFMNTGIISFPVKNSVGLTFIGADNETYMLPAQFNLPTKETKNSAVTNNASPAIHDKLLTLENFEPGEHLIRSISGAQVYVRNTGEVELSTPKMHRLSLSELEGSLETVVERTREHVGYAERFNGVYDPKHGDDSNEHHMYATYFEKVPNWETDEVLSKETLRNLINSETPNENVFPLKEEKPIAKYQMVNVYNEHDDNKKISDVDGEDLFYDFGLKKNERERFGIQLSKGGAQKTTSTSVDGVSETSIIIANKSYTIAHKNNSVTNELVVDDDKVAMDCSTGSSITVDTENEVTFKDSKGVNKLSELINRIEVLEGRL